jgi:hypothetical protein
MKGLSADSAASIIKAKDQNLAEKRLLPLLTCMMV